MKLKGFLLRENRKAENRMREMGEEYYIFRKCYPIYKIQIDNEFKGLYFQCEDLEIPIMYLLGYSFEGLITDDEKWSEIETFGKYRCEIKIVDKEYSDDVVTMEEYKF